MKTLTGRQLCRLLEQNGWQLLRVRGSHHVNGEPGEGAKLAVPVHRNEPLKTGMQRYILKGAGIDPERT